MVSSRLGDFDDVTPGDAELGYEVEGEKVTAKGAAATGSGFVYADRRRPLPAGDVRRRHRRPRSRTT